VVISDELNHASIIDGARLSRATIKVFPHKDVDARAQVLKDLPAGQRKLLITDGVFSMDGDLGAVPELCALGEEYGCIDDGRRCPSSGVFGARWPRHDRSLRHARPRRIQGRHAVQGDGALGGYVAGSKALIEFLYHRARPFLFSTSHPPAVAAACIAASMSSKRSRRSSTAVGQHALLQSRPEGARLQHRPEREPDHPGDRRRRRAGDETVRSSCSQEGVIAQGIAFPTVARDKARVRTIVTATHTRDELQFALDVFAKVGRELGLRLNSELA
jgi:glycine C-acetyltransferase